MNIYHRVVGYSFDSNLGQCVFYYKNGQPWVLAPRKYFEWNDGNITEVWRYCRRPLIQKSAYRRNPNHTKKEITVEEQNRREWKRSKLNKRRRPHYTTNSIGRDGKTLSHRKERRKAKQLIHHGKYDLVHSNLGRELVDAWFYD